MSILTEVTKKVEALYSAEKPDHGFLMHQLSNMSYSMLQQLKNNTRNNKLRIKSIDICSSMGISLYHTGAMLTKGILNFQDKTGVFKITLSDGTFMYYARWFSGAKFTDSGLITAEKEQ